MKDNVNVVFSKEQYSYLQTILKRISEEESNPLSSLASGAMGNLDKCTRSVDSPTLMLPECMASDLYNDNAADIIICLLNECAKLEKQECVEKNIPVVTVSDALEMAMSKAKELYGDNLNLEDSPIIAAFENCTAVISAEEQNLKVQFTGDTPLEFLSKVDVYISDKQ